MFKITIYAIINGRILIPRCPFDAEYPPRGQPSTFVGAHDRQLGKKLCNFGRAMKKLLVPVVISADLIAAGDQSGWKDLT